MVSCRLYLKYFLGGEVNGTLLGCDGGLRDGLAVRQRLYVVIHGSTWVMCLHSRKDVQMSLLLFLSCLSEDIDFSFKKLS